MPIVDVMAALFQIHTRVNIWDSYARMLAWASGSSGYTSQGSRV